MITNTTLTKKVVAPASVLALNSPFKRYGPENQRIIRKSEVKKDKAVEGLKELYRKTQEWWDPDDIYMPDVVFHKMVDPLKNHGYSAADIARYNLTLFEYPEDSELDWDLGIFLSALIYTGKDEKYVIHTRHLSDPINYLGCENMKNIVVEGDAGTWVGHGMEDGIITVKGEVCNLLGKKMKGGVIVVGGNAGHVTADGMTGGEIHIEGEIGSIGDVKHGKIYHKGKLILDK